MHLCASFFTNLQSQNAELIHIYNEPVYLHIARTPFGVNVHTPVSVQNYFMYARYSPVVVSQLLRWRQRSDSHTPNTQDIRSKCYISLITSSSFTRYGLAWSIKFELWCHIFTIFYKNDHWVPPLYRFSYQKHQTTCHVPLLAKWLNELISVWRLIINFPSICYKYFFPWNYKANIHHLTGIL